MRKSYQATRCVTAMVRGRRTLTDSAHASGIRLHQVTSKPCAMGAGRKHNAATSALVRSGAIEAEAWAQSVLNGSNSSLNRSRRRRSVRIAYATRAYHIQPLFVSSGSMELWCESCGSEAIAVNGATVCRSPNNYVAAVAPKMPSLQELLAQNKADGVSTRCYCTTCGSEAVLGVV